MPAKRTLWQFPLQWEQIHGHFAKNKIVLPPLQPHTAHTSRRYGNGIHVSHGGVQLQSPLSSLLYYYTFLSHTSSSRFIISPLMPERTRDEFTEFIWREFSHAQQEAPAIIANPGYQDVGCVDLLALFKGNWNPPGGGFFLDHEGYLEEWMKARREIVSSIGIHLYCGLLYVVEGLDTVELQNKRIKDYQRKVNSLNRQLHAHHQVKIDTNGSARQYMETP